MFLNLGEVIPILAHFFNAREGWEEKLISILKDIRYHTDMLLIAKGFSNKRAKIVTGFINSLFEHGLILFSEDRSAWYPYQTVPKEFHDRDAVALCPNWELVDFYIDEGASAPNMESASEWSRLIQDCFDKKVDLIITQKVSNVSRKMHEITLLARLLAAQKHPIGIYFISEDIFTLASYYQDDLRDTFFLPGPEVEMLPDEID